MTLTITPLPGIPLIHPGDDLAELIIKALHNACILLQNDDVLVITQKIISKSEGRFVNLNHITPSNEALQLAQEIGKNAGLVELILRESKRIIRKRGGTIIVEHRLGFICANAGIDHSNVMDREKNPGEWVLLLPENPNQVASDIRNKLEKVSGKRLGVLIIDSHGRAWRIGTIGTTIGLSGMPAIADLRGKPDLFGNQLQITQVGAADELAAAASLILGQSNEGTPVAHVRGFPYPLVKAEFTDLLRFEEDDLFR